MSIKEKVARVSHLLNMVLTKGNLNEEDKDILLQAKKILLEIEADLIGVQHTCESIINEAMKLSKYFRIHIIKEAPIPSDKDNKDAIKEYILQSWSKGQVLSSKELVNIIGDEKRTKEIIEELLKEHMIRIAKAEWEEGEVIVYYERIA